jgi:putative ABC transport system ATP-binding protein
MTAIASASGLYKFYGKGSQQVTVLQDVSFSVQEGEFLCIMGPSGSGKSTLLHIVSGLDQASAGSVTLAGAELTACSTAQRTRLRRAAVGYVFQFFNLLPNLDAEENVGLPLAIQGKREPEYRGLVRGLLERFGLGERRSAFPHQLSGGQMQRVSIARALAGGQPLLLCDEPTGNLSQKHGLEVMQTLRRVCDEDRRSVLLVTHNPRDACFADRVLFLVDGQIDKNRELRGPDIQVEAVHESLAALHI